MAKSRWRRTWVKMWVNESLEGTIRFEFSPAERGVWYDLILLAGRCRIPGIIAANENAPYPHSYVAGILNIDQQLLEVTLGKCKKSGRVAEDERGIVLLNWDHYQSEYERQKPYRGKKKEEAKEGEVTLVCPKCGHEKTFSSLPIGVVDCPTCKRGGKLIRMVERG